MQNKRTPASAMAFGGVMAALAVVVMCLGTLIPVATYVCPMLCCVILRMVAALCGSRTGWVWYAAVSILGILLAPDKEAAAVFAAIGYYPLVKPKLDRKKAGWLYKALLFNASILTMYWLLMHLFGLEQVTRELTGMGIAMTAVLLVLGNVTFFLLDRLLGMRPKRR